MAWIGVEGEDGGLLAGVWQALLAAVAAAFMTWLWLGGGGDGDGDGQQKTAEESKEPFQRTGDGVLSETKPACVSSPQEPLENHVTLSGHHHTPDGFVQPPELEVEVKDPIIPFMNCSEYLRSEASSPPKTASKLPQSHEVERREEKTSAQVGSFGDKPEEKLNQDLGPETPDPEDAEATWKPHTDDIGNKDSEQGKRIAAVPPMPQTVHVVFRVHYITHLEAQQIAITGDHECLGQWRHYIPLRCDKDGFWSDSVVLPFDTSVEWKFVLLESGKVARWEECSNRRLVTEHEDQVAHKSWGYH
ncbi:starch-binding domain-containing protein 1 [Notechis scutatus]|uniref:Starch-binding domain-containing protein 1 n=1 Tax=Notechis scutatus TaxID=8663 RepID=A0A6J1UPE8_9SAUR|nr:starch-binding domain-containing protein 1 [Notechis scutatus]